MDRGQAAFAVALTGIWSQVMILVYPLVGAILVFATGQLSTSTAVIAAVSAVAGALIVGLAVAALRSERSCPLARRRLRARSAPESPGSSTEPRRVGAARLSRSIRAERLVLLRRRWPRLTVATLGNQLSAFLVFELCLRAVGISFADLPLSEAFLGWAIGRVITSLPLTPGGIGVVELGMIGTLVGFGAPHAHVVAAVLLYRGLIVLPTLVIGLVALPLLRRLAPEPAEPA